VTADATGMFASMTPRQALGTLKVLALVLAIGLVPLAVAAVWVGHQSQARDEAGVDRELAFEAQERAAALERSFSEVQNVTLLVAQNGAFRRLFKRPGERMAKVRAGSRELTGVEGALAFLSRLYPGRISEASFRDANGNENARVVGGRALPPDKLSTSQKGSRLRPTEALAPGEVHQSLPHVSPVTERPVISNSTPVTGPGGSRLGVVHFELALESLRPSVTESESRFAASVLDARTGALVFDERMVARAGARRRPDRALSALVAERNEGIGEIGGERVAYRRLPRGPGNANEWLVLVRGGTASAATSSILPEALAAMVGALLLLGLVLARRFARVSAEVAELSASEAELRSVTLTDSLTGVRNHRAFQEDLARERQRAGRSGNRLSLVMIDFDGLKAINDALGHQAGDERIRSLAMCLLKTCRGGDTIYRVGGDEFAAILPGERAGGAFQFAQRLASNLAEDGSVIVACGVAEAARSTTRDELFRRAGVALSAAKRSERRILVYAPGLEPEQTASDAEAEQHHVETLATALARAVDAKDSYTRSHCATVSELCTLIGVELGLEPQRVESIRLAGLLHDVGKIGIADAILQKPSRLSEKEFEVMKTHSRSGHKIVSGAELPHHANWILHHHERIDGRGYPDGLAGSDIPLESRIILVADAFEAITADRPYRRGRGVREALAELDRHAGTQFDASCVRALGRTLGGGEESSTLAATGSPHFGRSTPSLSASPD